MAFGPTNMSFRGVGTDPMSGAFPYVGPPPATAPVPMPYLSPGFGSPRDPVQQPFLSPGYGSPRDPVQMPFIGPSAPAEPVPMPYLIGGGGGANPVTMPFLSPSPVSPVPMPYIGPSGVGSVLTRLGRIGRRQQPRFLRQVRPASTSPTRRFSY